MDSIDAALLDAWHALAPRLHTQRAELLRRALRSRTIQSRPIRPWSVALRAADTRLASLACLIPRDGPALAEPHTVIVSTADLRELVKPVHLPWPGIDWTAAAAALGRHPESLRHMIASGLLICKKYNARSVGKRGKPVPFIWSPNPLDPNADRLAAPDPVWGSIWQHLHSRIPEGYSAVLRRVPRFRPDRRGQRAHPDGRLRGWCFQCPGAVPLQRLPAVFDDDTPLPIPGAQCGRLVQRLFMPLPVSTIFDFLGSTPSILANPFAPSLTDSPTPRDSGSTAPPVPPPPLLACHRCLNLRYFSLLDRNGWNTFIAHLSAGLLYGREVPRPALPAAAARRKRRYVPHVRPAPRQSQIAQLIADGLTSRQIAAQLGIKYATVTAHIDRLYKRHHVHSRAQLIARLGLTPTHSRPALRAAG